ncbi:MAG: hypothetical protein IKT78_02625, partial [Ruminiclostridium sp.]|nr:hypothetical protein [Ruminiclostridium sp.]
MKRIVYSVYTKIAAVALFIISLSLGTVLATKGVKDYLVEKENNKLTQSFFSLLMDSPEQAVNIAFDSFFYEYQTFRRTNGKDAVYNGKTIEQYIEQELNNLFYPDEINYYIKWNDKVFTNCEAVGVEDLIEDEFYRLTERDENGSVRSENTVYKYNYQYPFMYEVSEYDEATSIIVCTSAKKEIAEEYKIASEKLAETVNNAILQTLACIIPSLIFFVYLICVCGKKADGEYMPMWIDSIWVEIHLFAIGGVIVGAFYLCIILVMAFLEANLSYDVVNMLIGAVAAVASGVILTSSLSIVRIIKCRRFLKVSVIAIIVKWVIKAVISVLKWIFRAITGLARLIYNTLSKKTGILLIAMLLVYTVAICVLSRR